MAMNRCNYRATDPITTRYEREDGWRCGHDEGHIGSHALYTSDGEEALYAGVWVEGPEETVTFEDAARAEAERRAPLDGHTAPALEQEREGLAGMAEWVRSYLAGQEPDGDDLRPFCAGCGDRIEMSRCLEYGVCSGCINTTDDPWFKPRSGEGSAAEQEPSDAEVEAARKAADDHDVETTFWRNGDFRWAGCSACDMEITDYVEQERHVAREALRAAARIRKEQER